MSRADSPPLAVTVRGDRVLVDVQVVPRASKSRIVGAHGGRLKVTLAAPPVEGAANEELVALLAKSLRIPKRDVEIVRGETGRRKTVALRGVTRDSLVRALQHGDQV